MGGMVDGIYCETSGDMVDILRPVPMNDLKPEVTILTMFIAREKMFTKWLKNFKELNTPKRKTHVLWVCFAKGPKALAFSQRLKKEFIELKGYHSKTLVINHEHMVIKGGDEGGDWQSRNQAITDGYNFCREYTQNSKYVFLFEDDILQPKDALTKLLPFLDNEHIGQVVGFIPYRPNGRHRCKPLAWTIKRQNVIVGNNVASQYQVYYMEVQHGGCEEIGAGTFGCTLIRGDLFRSVVMINYLDGIMGPDVTYGPLLLDRGYKSMIDWSTRCKQMDEKKGIVTIYA
jgi:hypothetical protein